MVEVYEDVRVHPCMSHGAFACFLAFWVGPL